MKTLFMTALAVLLGACAATVNDFYEPADSPGEYGYSEVQLDENRYRVSFTGDARTNDQAVRDLALMRAAELTDRENRDWFRVVTVETEETTLTSRSQPGSIVEVPEPDDGDVVYRECGPLGCTTTITEEYSGAEVVTRRDADRYVTTVEIIMGDGPVVDPTTVYNADELFDFLESRYTS